MPLYSIIDLETTGRSPERDKVTEIAVYVFDGEKIVREFVSLIYPERTIPSSITQLTGIDNEMVANSPRFFEVAKQIVEITEGTTFVAHNVAFDYNFLREEFRELGFDFRRKKLCTVRLSRQLLPGMPSYSLGRLCSDLGIVIKSEDRHRAAGDALATVKLFQILLATEHGPELIGGKKEPAMAGLHVNLDRDKVEMLPEEPGVYYFYNERKDLIYIGKSKNIRTRVLTHLRNNDSKKAMEMKRQIADVGFETTGSELIALLKESSEIKEFMPVYNRKQKRAYGNHAIVAHYDISGYIHLKVERIKASLEPLSVYSSAAEAQEELFRLVNKYQLCQKLCGLYKTQEACFHYGIRKCNGACIGKEPIDRYNDRAQDAISSLQYHSDNFVLIDKGMHSNNRAVVLVENGKYLGYSFMDTEELEVGLDAIRDAIQPQLDNRDVRSIIRSFVRNGKVEKVLKF